MDKWGIRQTIDLARGGIGPGIWPNTLMVSGDREAHTWEIEVRHAGQSADLTGVSVTAYFNRADNATVPVKGSVEGSIARVTLEQACYAVPGVLTGIFRLTTASGEILTASVLRFTVSAGPCGTIVDPGNVIPSLDDLLAQIELMEQGTAAANAAASKANAAAGYVDANMDAKITARVDTTLSEEYGIADAKATGEALSSLKGDIDSKFDVKESVNLWNPETTIIGQIQTNGSVKTSATDYVATDYIPYKIGEQIWVCYYRRDTNSVTPLTPQPSTGSCLALYDKDKNFLKYISGATLLSAGRGYTIENADCAYIRFGLAYLHWSNAMRIYCLSKVNIETVEDFEEYYAPIVSLKNVTDPSNPTKVSELENDEGYIRESEQLNARVVSCRGDSLTDGAGATSGNTYPKLLQDLLGGDYTVNNFGVGGDGTKGISWRFGATPIYLAPCTIPESGSVDCKIVDASGADVTFLLRGGMIPPNPSLSNFNVNPVIIGGIEGVLARSSTTANAYTFTRSESGLSVTIDRPAFISTYGYRNNTKDITIFWCGTNDTQSWKGYTYIINYLRQMIDLLPHKKYIVCGLTCLNMHPDIATKNEQLSFAFGRHFLDLRYYLLNYGLADAGITPTEEDEAAIARGEISPSLLYDNVHFNSYGYAVIANYIYKKGIELGYW